MLGDFDLFGDGPSYMVETLAEGTEWGSPEPIEVVIRSLLLESDVALNQGYTARTVGIRVIITASDSAALAQGANDLFAEVGKRNELTYTPADGFGEPTVFEVRNSSQVETPDDLAELRGELVISLSLTCLPFGRSASPETVTPTGTNVGTGRQKGYTLDIAGSAPTRPDLHVGGSSALGLTLIYTRPGAQGMVPLRQYRTGGGSVTSASTWVSGGYDNNITTAFTASAQKDLVPDGSYILLALVRKESGSGTVTLTSSVSTQVAGFDVATPDTRSTAASLTTSYSIVQLGSKFQVPNGAVIDEANADVVVSIQASAATRLDEAWLVEVGTGALTWLDSAPTTVGMIDAQHFWIEQPTTARDSARIIKGALPNQVLAFAATNSRWAYHRFEPGANSAFVVTTGTTTGLLDLSYWPRWHTHAEAV